MRSLLTVHSRNKFLTNEDYIYIFTNLDLGAQMLGLVFFSSLLP